MVLEKVHKVQTFDQSRWVRPYVQDNTESRRKATNPFEASIAKLRVRNCYSEKINNFLKFFQNNSFFGKSIEDQFSYVDHRIVNSPKVFDRLSNEANFKRGEIYHEELSMAEMKKVSTCLSKPRFVL